MGDRGFVARLLAAADADLVPEPLWTWELAEADGDDASQNLQKEPL